MRGMLVTFYFNNFQAGSTAEWIYRGGDDWMASSGGSLTLKSFDDTFSTAWTLSNVFSTLPLTRVVIDGTFGNVLFDRASGGTVGTPNSVPGVDFVFDGPGLPGTVALYTNVAGVGGAPPVGDLFERLDVSFGPNGLAPGASVRFRAAAVTVAPEPSPIALAAPGLVLLAAFARRRRATS